MTRLYRIINKDTGMVLFQVNSYFASGVAGRWEDPADDGYYRGIDDINFLVEETIRLKATHILDNCELQAYEKKYIPVKGSVKLINVRNRLEQKEKVKKWLMKK
jgi:hypothetical protein